MNPIARMMKRYVKTPLKYALPLLFIAALVLVSISGCTSPATTSPSPSASSVPTATPIATATPTATPTAKPATPTITPMSASDLAALDANLQSHGYTITQHFVQNGTTDGYPTFTGMSTKDGLTYGSLLVQTDSPASAQAYLPTAVASVQDAGFSGSYTDSQTWTGSMTGLSGAQMNAMVSVMSGSDVLIQMAE